MYAAWSPDSRYLAATSDSLHAVAVWRVHVSTSRTDGGPRPAVPQGGVPARSRAPVPAHRVPPVRSEHRRVGRERGGRVHAYDLRCAVAAAESTSSAVDLSPPKRREAPLAAAATEAAGEADADDGSGSGSRSDDGWELLPEEGVDVSLYPSAGGSGMGRARRERPATIRADDSFAGSGVVRHGSVRGGGADAAAPPADRRGARTALGPGAFRTQAPPHDLVFIGVPNGVLRFRCPVAWTPETHGDFPVAFRRAARAFLLCAEADARRGGGGGGEGLPRSAIFRGRYFCARWVWRRCRYRRGSASARTKTRGEADVVSATDSRKRREPRAGRDSGDTDKKRRGVCEYQRRDEAFRVLRVRRTPRRVRSLVFFRSSIVRASIAAGLSSKENIQSRVSPSIFTRRVSRRRTRRTTTRRGWNIRRRRRRRTRNRIRAFWRARTCCTRARGNRRREPRRV